MQNKKIKSAVIQTLKISITVLVIYWIINQFGWNKITTTIKSAQPEWILGGVTLFVISIFLGALQWRALLKNRGIDLPLGKTISVYFTGIFFNNFMLGMVAGDSYKVAHLHFNNQKAESGFAATFFDRIAGLLVISLFALVGGVYLFASGTSGEQNLNGVLVVTLLFATLLIGFFALFLSKRLQKLAEKAVNKLPSGKVQTQIHSILQELFIDRHDKAEKRTFQTVLIYSFWIQLLRVTVHIMAAVSLGLFHWSGVHYFFIIIPIIAFMTIIPLPFGIKEAVGGTLFLAAGFVHEQAVVMEFLATLMGIGGSLFGGVMFIIDKNKHDE